ncbi:hypothetical protein CON65_15840 [Bacillus pseudomycoides]|uniref:Uncharacterized protein n=1 Tax=Bacillus pseudomycoides TaxID=64104 RepID=A0AA91VAM1_9BACI|nr:MULTISPECIES: hypothetical protein [Bacillus]PEB56230.1 hypothetical protein COO03_01275 [Bacillus sp. AFS098217]PED81660.1 hypothetical protein CON65_15840 [Bacillus pseudomycoides]
MDKLNTVVEDLLKEIDTDFRVIKTYIKTVEGLLEQQENKVRETATTLLPVMRKIQSNMFNFISQDERWVTRKGPILKYNDSKNSLYIFSIENEGPIILNLDTERETIISYDKLLKEVEFNTVMESLLSVVSYTGALHKKYQGIIDKRETELVKYRNL